LCFRSVINVVSQTSGNIVNAFRGHEHLVTAIYVVDVVQEEGVIVYSTSVDGTILVWELVSIFTYI
jgi:hypothetical protein